MKFSPFIPSSDDQRTFRRSPKDAIPLSLPPCINYGENSSGSPKRVEKTEFLPECIPVKTGVGVTS
jgi:hypothetical protein